MSERRIKRRLPVAGYFPHRLKGNLSQARRERAFAYRWAHHNPLIRGENRWLDSLLSNLEAPSDRDHAIAATVIQWLGSDVGWSFLADVMDDLGFKVAPKAGGDS